MDSKKEPLGKRLERLRTTKGLTAKAVARQIGVPESTYREWENGRGLRLPPFQKISQVLAITVTELVTGKQPPLVELYKDLESIEEQLRASRLKIGSLL